MEQQLGPVLSAAAHEQEHCQPYLLERKDCLHAPQCAEALLKRRPRRHAIRQLERFQATQPGCNPGHQLIGRQAARASIISANPLRADL